MLLRERGFHGVVLTKILGAAQASKGSAYRHFPGGNSELAIAVVHAIAQVCSRIEAHAVERAPQLRELRST